MKFRGALVTTAQLMQMLERETGKSPFMMSVHNKNEVGRWLNGQEPRVDNLNDVLLANGYELVVMRKG